MTATRTTKKVRANTIRKGDRVMIQGQAVEVASHEHTQHFPGWPANPYTSVTVKYVEGSGFVQSGYGWSEWVEVAR